MIEIYCQNIGGTHFAFALNQNKIVVSTFSRSQKKALKSILFYLPFNESFQVFHEPTPGAKKLLLKFKSIYDGEDVGSKFYLATVGLSVYTKKVIKATIAIPLGYVTSYGAIAEVVGGGARAVGNAMACNKFPPFVPCHRVVKSDFGLAGYGPGGLRVKLDFLAREKRGFSEPKEIEVDGSILRVFPVENVLKKFT